ncbi:HlyU family transcriptional regulator [Aliiroseovarius sp. S2029]|uniref:HlyU family transcriptional regulator n=1 Tax=Aliiroseovarius sp. S2029 TaxID=2936988 RepID=UPI0020C000BA|nr:HlyU family transcriptional regulator [Aliiroseovarius sp. S2029]MCK8484868.1 HlyU family transcriptional regulator [Aliiroseovarius sp. S2029]
MSLLSKLFGGGSASAQAGSATARPDPVMHDGFAIYPEPAKDTGGYRIGARIEKQIDGELKSRMMIRADVLGSQEAATSESLRKARIYIDQMGERIFD